MVSARRRLDGLEARIGTRASPVGQLTPEAERERTRQFRRLYRELRMPWPPEPKDREEEVFEELFERIDTQREEIYRKGDR